MNIAFPNHSGTHIDLPCHFDPDGISLNDYSPSFWEFTNVELVDLTNKVDEFDLITSKFLPKINNNQIDLLLIKTGFGEYRGTDKYTLRAPGISFELAHYLRKKFPKIRCIGMDLISISSYSKRKEGHKSHHAFLNPKRGNPILLIEDMKITDVAPFEKVIVAPLMIENSDGAPCTIFGYPAP
tara:strand:- start:151 stop:699 length:549 start_codon:yes stop_codon:yes gene_type:complete